MNWNSQKPKVDHLVHLQQNPKDQARIDDFRKKRIDRVEKALQTRPCFLTASTMLDPSATTEAYTVTTPQLPYDIIIIGAVTSHPNLPADIRRMDGDRPFAFVGDTSTRMTLAEMCGASPDVDGAQKSPFYFTAPILLRANSRLIVNLWKDYATVSGEDDWFYLTFIAVKVMRKGVQALSTEDKAQLSLIVARRAAPEPRLLKQSITINATTGQSLGNYSPTSDEPLLVRGMRTSFIKPLISLEIEGEPAFTANDSPIYALAATQENSQENYVWFDRPVLLPAKTSFVAGLRLSSTVSSDDPAETTGTITYICETV